MNGSISNSPPWSFHLQLYSESELLANLWLPDNVDGFYRFSPSAVSYLFNVEALNGCWVIHCMPPAFFEDVSMSMCQDFVLSGTTLLKLSLDGLRLFILAEKTEARNLLYTRHILKYEAEILIGCGPDCDVSAPGSLLCPHHALLSHTGTSWSIRPANSDSLIYVNGKRVLRQDLKLGDHVCLTGLHILIGTNFISVNDPGGGVSVSERVSRAPADIHGRYQSHSGYSVPAPEADPLDDSSLCFNRAPRKIIQEDEQSISVEGPPMSMRTAGMPLILRMGSSMVMGGRAAATGNYAGLLTSLLFPLLSSRYTEDQRREYEDRRFLRYTEYLNHKKDEIQTYCTREAARLNLLFPDFDTVLRQSRERVRLWERRPEDDDFLVIRLGSGSSKSNLQLDFPKEHLELEQDDLVDLMRQITEKDYVLQNVPICLSLRESPVVGILGSRPSVLELVRQTIVQLAARHSYDEVKILLLADPAEMDQFRFVRFLPHCWNDSCDVRFLAADEPDACTLGEYLKNGFPDSPDIGRGSVDGDCPHYVVFAMSHSLFSSVEFFKTIMKTPQLLSYFSFLTAFDDLPKECSRIVELHEDGCHLVNSLHSSAEPSPCFHTDAFRNEDMMLVARMMSNLKIKAATQKQSLPKMLTFMEMFQAGKLEHLNPLKRWKESDPIRSLSAPVGVHPDGTLFCLDLHEKHQGPHGLIAGMTGSGKSEFIITYILSMAVNYHPDEVAFIVIDYKGGGLADAFHNPRTGIKLPHLVGTITNLDGAAIERSLMSIQSELIRRQNVFHHVQNRLSAGTIDIYAYQKLYRAGKVSQPMPHLFIVSDEFAELKQQKPEFMEKLVSASRIGRSLGIHLILATQKPSGVVNDQIRSNTKFRVCLRVQDRMDSMDMLRRPEAAELKDTGRFYLQVGYNEYFALGQSAWCGAEYTSQEEPPVSRDDSIEFLDTVGRVITKVAPTPPLRKTGVKQIAAVVEYLSGIADRIGYQSKPLWQPPLPEKLDLDGMPEEKDPLKIPLGLLDDPGSQAQFPLVLDLHKCQHTLIIGEARSGKTTAVRSILCSLVQKNSPKTLNFYILDYSSRSLKDFSRLPHCGSVLQDEDTGSLGHFFDILGQLKETRKRLFSDCGVDNYEDAATRMPLPLVLVIIDNLPGLSETKTGADMLFNLPKLMKGAANYGILFLITCSHLNEIPSRILQEISCKFCLTMKDKYDYSAVLGTRVTYTPPALPGRGLFLWEEKPLELQIAMFQPRLDIRERRRRILALLTRIAQDCGDSDQVRQMPVLDLDAAYQDFSRQFDHGRLPLGFALDTKQPVALPFRQFSALSVYQGNPLGLRPILENLLYAAHRENMELWIVKSASGSCFAPEAEAPMDLSGFENIALFEPEGPQLSQLWNRFYETCSNRRVLLQDHCVTDCGDLGAVFPCLRKYTVPVLLLMENFADFCRNLDYIHVKTFTSGFAMAQKRNIYPVAVFGPDSPEPAALNSLYGDFNADGNALVFSDQPQRKVLPQVPVFPAPDGKSRPFNAFTMLYRGTCHPMVMPCGSLTKEVQDPDELSIF